MKAVLFGKHKLYGSEVEVAVRQSVLASSFSKHYLVYISDMTIITMRVGKKEKDQSYIDERVLSD